MDGQVRRCWERMPCREMHETRSCGLPNSWTGSFLEFLPMMQLMKDQYTPQTLPYHLIATSMPGYGFSTPPPPHRELGILEVPNMFNQMMLDLGFKDGYIAQGGDIGSRFARILAAKHDACKGLVNFFSLGFLTLTNLQLFMWILGSSRNLNLFRSALLLLLNRQVCFAVKNFKMGEQVSVSISIHSSFLALFGFGLCIVEMN